MPDYMYALESRLSPEQRAAILRVQELARHEELNIYLTGSSVRDLILGMPIRSLEFVVEGNPARMLRELEKGGASILNEDDRLRSADVIFSGDVDGSLAAARDEVYERPGSRPDIRWASIMEDLRRRDFSVNAVALSLNPASRGLLLDPMNGLADLERREVRTLSMHSFTNQPIRLLSILRFCARLDFKMEERTQERFDLALERRLHEEFDPNDVGQEMRALSREDNLAGIVRAWEQRGLLASVQPQFVRRRPNEDDLGRLFRAREFLLSAGLRPRLQIPSLFYLLKRFPPRDRTAVMKQWKFSAAQIDALDELLPQTQKLVRLLNGRKTDDPREAYAIVSKLPLGIMGFLIAEFGKSRASNKVRNYVQKWRPMRLALPVAELDALGVPRGPKFDKILEDFFAADLKGKVKLPPERTKLLRQLAGIKDEPPKKEEKKRTREREFKAMRASNAPGQGGEATASPARGKRSQKSAAPEVSAKPAPKSKPSAREARPAPRKKAKHGKSARRPANKPKRKPQARPKKHRK